MRRKASPSPVNVLGCLPSVVRLVLQGFQGDSARGDVHAHDVEPRDDLALAAARRHQRARHEALDCAAKVHERANAREADDPPPHHLADGHVLDRPQPLPRWRRSRSRSSLGRLRAAPVAVSGLVGWPLSFAPALGASAGTLAGIPAWAFADGTVHASSTSPLGPASLWATPSAALASALIVGLPPSWAAAVLRRTLAVRPAPARAALPRGPGAVLLLAPAVCDACRCCRSQVPEYRAAVLPYDGTLVLLLRLGHARAVGEELLPLLAGQAADALVVPPEEDFLTADALNLQVVDQVPHLPPYGVPGRRLPPKKGVPAGADVDPATFLLDVRDVPGDVVLRQQVREGHAVRVGVGALAITLASFPAAASSQLDVVNEAANAAGRAAPSALAAEPNGPALAAGRSQGEPSLVVHGGNDQVEHVTCSRTATKHLLPRQEGLPAGPDVQEDAKVVDGLHRPPDRVSLLEAAVRLTRLTLAGGTAIGARGHACGAGAAGTPARGWGDLHPRSKRRGRRQDLGTLT
eukprot:CAMPEP_0171183224 /NCGR_PEP_ID=MMETSP0790-20130122/15170_1 /TAXON_ID=2925 /ORGANISM="Alexandrium catenella, Strain OF101" /LENGTH=520 /DNA_ID=CAMNT_0011648197 /DNA_START=34 /DNA_END=1593 /DNA_ORIENTATION=+